MTILGPHVPPFGPSPARVALVGEAPGSEESEALRPLVGPTGRQLRHMLRTIGVSLDDCFRTNVFSRQPSGNNIALYGRIDPSPASRALGPFSSNPQLFVDDCHLPELDRLRAELVACRPNIIVALGNVAAWALLGQIGIGSLRGSVYTSDFLWAGLGRPVKVLPTFHPALIFRQWDARVIIIADLEKAFAEAHTPEFTYDNTELWLAPTLDDLADFEQLHMLGARECATDVETKRGQITCVSFAPTPDVALVVPFWQDGPQPSYWPDHASEVRALRWCARIIEDPAITKVLQNGLYDIQYFIAYGMRPRGFTEDTMLASHSLWSELKKGLGFLGSVHANVPSWKSMRTYRQEELTKRDD